MVLAHVKKLRQNEFLSHALCVIVIEANNPIAAVDLRDELKRKGEPQIMFMTEAKGTTKAKNQPGIITTAYSKERMVNIMKDYLRHKKMCFAEDFVCALPNHNKEIHDLKAEYEKQMRKFSKKKIVTRDHKNDVDKVHYTYSGKVVGENDDLPMATMFAGYGKEIFFSKENRARYGVYW